MNWEDFREDLVTYLDLMRQRQESIPNILEESERIFPQQANFVKSKSLKKSVFCTRRSAKSFSGGLHLVYTALNYDNCNCLYLGLTREAAKGIIWKDILKRLNLQYQLGATFNETALTMTFQNGSMIWATGVDADEDEMNKLLGRKYKLVIIDEASMYSIDVHNLVYGVLDPAMTDEGGTICLLGTASNFPRGLFFDITTGKERGWDLHKWTAHDNPYVAKQWAAKLAEIAKDRPLYMETPQFKQWYLNQWVIDEEKLCYKFSQDRNLVKALPFLPQDGWTFVLGLDTGWEDDSGFCLTAYHEHDPYLYVVRSFKRPKMTFEDVENKIREFTNHSSHSPHRIIIDGANKQGVESMRARSGIPFEFAEKQDKVTFIELANSDFMEGKIKIVDCPDNKPLIDELAGLVWMSEGDKIKYPKKEHPELPNHLCDAFLYAWRCGYHYASRPAVKKIIYGSKEWYEQQASEVWDRERDNLMHQNRNSGWSIEGDLGDLG